MKKLLLALSLLTSQLYAQQAREAVQTMLNNVDTSYIDAEMFRWQEFSMPVLRAYKIMDAFEADTTCDCMLLKGNKAYIQYLKDEDIKMPKKSTKNVIGHLECRAVYGYYVIMWMQHNDAYGILVNSIVPE